MAWLREHGFDCRAASVAPTGSAWDRASKMRHRASVRDALRPDRRLHSHTAGGMTVDETWRENDGLVNTISARAPSGASWKPLDKSSIRPGLWNVFPTVDGDHMWPQGGLLHRHDIRGFYLDLLTMIRDIL